MEISVLFLEDLKNWITSLAPFCYCVIYSRFCFYRESYHCELFWRIVMRVSSISPPNLSLIGPQTMDRNYWTDRQTDRETNRRLYSPHIG